MVNSTSLFLFRPLCRPYHVCAHFQNVCGSLAVLVMLWLCALCGSAPNKAAILLWPGSATRACMQRGTWRPVTLILLLATYYVCLYVYSDVLYVTACMWSQIKPDRFAVMVEEVTKEYRNMKYGQPYSWAMYRRGTAVWSGGWQYTMACKDGGVGCNLGFGSLTCSLVAAHNCTCDSRDEGSMEGRHACIQKQQLQMLVPHAHMPHWHVHAHLHC